MSPLYKSLPAVALLAFSAPAWALTPLEAWDALAKDLGAAAAATQGQLTFSAPVSEGQSLIIRDVVYTLNVIADGETSIEARMTPHEIRLSPAGGDRVTLSLPPSIPVQISDGHDVFALELYSDPAQLTLSGAALSPLYEAQLNRLGLRSLKGQSPDDMKLDFSLIAANISGQTAKMLDLSAQNLLARLSFKEEGGAAYSAEFNATAPSVKLLSTGEQIGAIDYSLTAPRLTVSEADGMSLTASAASLASHNQITPSHLQQTFSAAAVDIALPENLGLTIASLTSSASVPYKASVKPQAFDFNVNVAGFSPSASAWALLDESQNLPRTPAMLTLALNGAVVVSEEALLGAALPEPTELSLNSFNLSLLGATLTGSGHLTLPLGALSQPIPPATGTMTFTASGVSQAIHALQSAALLDSSSAALAVMGLAMFATANGPDNYTSTIEFQNGAVTLNGMALD